MKTILALLTAFALIYGVNIVYQRSFGPSPLSQKIDEVTSTTKNTAEDAARTVDQLQSDAEKKVEEGKRLADKVRSTKDDLAKSAQAAKDAVAGK